MFDAFLELWIIGIRKMPPFTIRDLQAPFIEFDMGDRTVRPLPPPASAKSPVLSPWDAG